MSCKLKAGALLMPLFIVAIISVSVAVRAGQSKNPTESVSAGQLPPQIISTIERVAPGVQIKEAEKSTRRGKTTYAVKIIDAGAETIVKIDEDGTILNKGFNQASGNEQAVLINADQLPPPAREAVVRLGNSARPIKVTQETRQEGVIYTVYWTTSNGEKSIEMTPDGQVSTIREPMAATEVPALVQSLVTQSADEASEIRYSRQTTMVFAVQATVDGQLREILMTPSGKLVGQSTLERSTPKSKKTTAHADGSEKPTSQPTVSSTSSKSKQQKKSSPSKKTKRKR